ncbi:MAG TPA: MarR family transcriptional regulator [Acidimicrobiia bacterium]|jgi:DNA-binding MarR family transcriptional regulator|nr:MarR family transcriptional regulator [Acidimicrobiia bacterium]
MPRSDFVSETVAGWTRLRPEQDLSSLGIVQRLIWTGRLAEELLERTAMAGGLRRRGDYEVLALLRRSEPFLPTPLEVAQQLRTSQSGMTGKLDRLEEQGLIERVPDADDRRAIRLGVTEAGRELIDAAFTMSLNVYESMLEELSAREAKTFETLLEKVLARLDELSGKREPWAAT